MCSHLELNVNLAFSSPPKTDFRNQKRNISSLKFLLWTKSIIFSEYCCTVMLLSDKTVNLEVYATVQC